MLVWLCLLLLLLFWNSCLLVLRITYIFIFIHSDDSEWFSLCLFFGTAHTVRIYLCTRTYAVVLHTHTLLPLTNAHDLFSLHFIFLWKKTTQIQPLICFENWTLSRSHLINFDCDDLDTFDLTGDAQTEKLTLWSMSMIIFRQTELVHTYIIYQFFLSERQIQRTKIVFSCSKFGVIFFDSSWNLHHFVVGVNSFWPNTWWCRWNCLFLDSQKFLSTAIRSFGKVFFHQRSRFVFTQNTIQAVNRS